MTQISFETLPQEVARLHQRFDALELAVCNRKLEDPEPIEIIDGATLCYKLDITRQTLARWRKTNRIPFIQAGAVIRYDLNKVIEALENRKKKGGYNG